MGREISERSNGDWWVIETSTNAFKRVSSVFDSKEALLAALKVGGLAPYILEKFLTSNYIPSTFTTAGYTFSASEAIDAALTAVGCLQKTGHRDCVNPDYLDEANDMKLPGGMDFEVMMRKMMNGEGMPGSKSFDPAEIARQERNGTYEPNPIGEEVQLHSLAAGTQYNGLRAKVLSRGKNGRQAVRVKLPDGGEKELKIKYENIYWIRKSVGDDKKTREEIERDIESAKQLHAIAMSSQPPSSADVSFNDTFS